MKMIARLSLVNTSIAQCYNEPINFYLYNIITTESGVTPRGFVESEPDDFDDLGLTIFGKKRILRILKEVTK